MLCVENDDQTAAMTCELMAEAGLEPSDFTPWNAYPWYINRAPTRAEIASASEALVALVRLMPRLRVVILQGSEAQRSWKILMEAAPDLYDLDLFTIETYHPSVQALKTSSVAERRWRVEHRKRAWRQAAALLR
ncbi:uracil-DNA glycosylase [Paramicrobacterium sp. CJ85]|uniref:uracil-DNA glycosylase n=1 Tax=Paramicrobacterium sp. CJ85 TaxID=3445355 RepID=UPI003F605085